MQANIYGYKQGISTVNYLSRSGDIVAHSVCSRTFSVSSPQPETLKLSVNSVVSPFGAIYQARTGWCDRQAS